MEREDAVKALLGEKVNSICFVEDYVELHFNGPYLRCLTAPIFTLYGEEFRFPDPGSREALCAFIGLEVTGAEVEDEVAIRLRFHSGDTLTVPLDQGSRIGPEAAHMRLFKDPVMYIW